MTSKTSVFTSVTALALEDPGIALVDNDLIYMYKLTCLDVVK